MDTSNRGTTDQNPCIDQAQVQYNDTFLEPVQDEYNGALNRLDVFPRPHGMNESVRDMPLDEVYHFLPASCRDLYR